MIHIAKRISGCTGMLCRRIFTRLVGVAFWFIGLSGCGDFLEIPIPRNELVSEGIFNDDPSAVTRGMYITIMGEQAFNGGIGGIAVATGLAADDFDAYYGTNADMEAFFRNAVLASNGALNTIWRQLYKYIYHANSLLEGLEGAPTTDPVLVRQLQGEAKFIRALCHLYLTAIWGEVPVILSTDYRANSAVRRTSVPSIYRQVIEDLQAAETLLAEDYRHANNERIRPNRWAATALLARAYLYAQDWANAEKASSQVISQELYALLVEEGIDGVYHKNSQEAILQFMPVQSNINTQPGNIFILAARPTVAALSPDLLGAFEHGDLRKAHWVGSTEINGTTYRYPYKYKVRNATGLTEYLMVLGIAEQYLIRAEARAQQDRISGESSAASDLNAIRGRAGLEPIALASKAHMLDAIEKERRLELFSEWGHRWFDLNRTRRADAVLSATKPGWLSQSGYFPIPEAEVAANPQLEAVITEDSTHGQ